MRKLIILTLTLCVAAAFAFSFAGISTSLEDHPDFLKQLDKVFDNNKKTSSKKDAPALQTQEYIKGIFLELPGNNIQTAKFPIKQNNNLLDITFNLEEKDGKKFISYEFVKTDLFDSIDPNMKTHYPAGDSNPHSPAEVSALIGLVKNGQYLPILDKDGKDLGFMEFYLFTVEAQDITSGTKHLKAKPGPAKCALCGGEVKSGKHCEETGYSDICRTKEDIAARKAQQVQERKQSKNHYLGTGDPHSND